LIPFQMARVNDVRQLIEVAADKETLKNGPTFDDDREITPQFEKEVYSYYGLKRTQTIEHSGSYAAHSAEQSTQTTAALRRPVGRRTTSATSWTKQPGEAGAGERRARRPPPRKWGSLAPGESRRMFGTSGPNPKSVASRK
jgi:hypothetical protein